MNTGNTFNMEHVATILTLRGIKSYVEMTGGGCATIMCGTANDQGYFPVVAGPGTFNHRDVGYSVAYLGDFTIGQETDDDDFVEYFGTDDENEVADEIEKFYHKVVK
jgi:uncharacterized protein YceK